MKGQCSYQVMPRACLGDKELQIRAIGEADVEDVRLWRNAQMDVLRQNSEISPDAQQRYFAEHVWPDKLLLQPKQVLVGIERHGTLIGYGGLVHISWPYRRAEVSFLLEPKLERDLVELRVIFARFLSLIQELAFKDLQLHRLTTETYAHRLIHIQALEDAGHRFEGRLRGHVSVNGRPMDALMHGILANEWHLRSQTTYMGAVLVTSASSKAPLIRAVKTASTRSPYQWSVTAGDTDPLAPAQYEADSFWQMPRLSDEGLNELIDGCRARAISVVLPTRDAELAFWSRHRDAFAQAGVEVIVSTPEAILRCRDKLSFSRFGLDADLPMIPTAITPDALGDGLFVVKERFGAGSRGIGLALTKLAAIEHARSLQDPVFQPFVSGPEISIDGWVGKDGRVVGVVLRRRDRVVSGESQVTTTFSNAFLEEQAISVLAALQLRGPVVMQAIIVDGGIQVIECNPRFGGASTASIAAGLDSLSWSLNETLGEAVPPTFQRRAGEIRQIRMPVDRVIHDSDL